MTGENAETVPLPVANCVLCRWPMDGTVNILEVQIGTAVYRACAEECERHAAHHEHCRVGARVCRSCEAACDALLAAIG